MLMFFSMYFMLNPPVLMSLQEAPEIYWWGSSPPRYPSKKKTKSFSASTGAEGGDGQHALAYEDKDGDLMLVGDVPWDMFISSCKKLRIMKGSEAR